MTESKPEHPKQDSIPTTENTPPASTPRLGENSVRFDPLLDSVIAIAKIFGITTTLEALSAGLPLEGNRITPDLLPRAAGRAGLTLISNVLPAPCSRAIPGWTHR